MSRFTKCDKLFRELILLDRRNACQRCGKIGVLQIAHILPKGCHPRLRYQRANALILCFYCHIIFAHRNPLEFTEWLKGYKGVDILDTLRQMERMLPKVDLKMTELILKKQIEELKK